MKLIRCGTPGHEKPGIIAADGSWRDVSGFCADFDPRFFGSDGVRRLGEWLRNNEAGLPEINSGARLGPPVAMPGKIICIGLNYRDHARESGMELPAEPVVFFKATSALNGPYDPVVLPRDGHKTDWEVELAVVIGKTAKYVEQSAAMEHVAGFTVHNDLSERHFQLERGGQWVKGKSCDTFAPLGPFLVTPDETGDPHQLDLWLELNGERVQNSNTSNLVFGVPFLISYLSRFMSLQPGDIISTGTPAGVGLGFDPPRYLKAGDVVELGIAGLGVQRQEVLPAE